MRKGKVFMVSFPADELDLYDYIKTKHNTAKYIRGLIKQDMQGKKLKDILEEYLKNKEIKPNDEDEESDLSQFKEQFKGLMSLGDE